MILAQGILHIQNSDFAKTFLINIQFGAILAVLVMYFKRFFQTLEFYKSLFIAFIPAAVLGFLLNDFIDSLLESVPVVAVSLVLGGFVLIWVDKIFKQQNTEEKTANNAEKPKTDEAQNEIDKAEQDANDASQDLQQQQNQSASKNQKSASKNMKSASQKLSQMQQKMQEEEQAEDLSALRQLLKNILSLSFDQEKLMANLKQVNINNPKYPELMKEQNRIRENSEMVEDSLYALAKRVFKIKSFL